MDFHIYEIVIAFCMIFKEREGKKQQLYHKNIISAFWNPSNEHNNLGRGSESRTENYQLKIYNVTLLKTFSESRKSWFQDKSGNIF